MTSFGSSDEDDVRVKGDDGTDQGQLIGAVGDRLKVDAAFSSSGGISSPVPSMPSTLVYDDMNVGNGGIAREATVGATFTQVYSYTGSGLLIGILLTLESSEQDWFIRIVVDGNEIFTSTGINTTDIQDDKIYNYKDNQEEDHLGLSFEKDTIRWESPLSYPMAFQTDVKVFVRKVGGSKKWYAGLISLVKA